MTSPIIEKMAKAIERGYMHNRFGSTEYAKAAFSVIEPVMRHTAFGAINQTLVT